MSEQKPLSGDQVAAWLRDHTDFFQGRQELLELLKLPDPRGNAVSLLERQAHQAERLDSELLMLDVLDPDLFDIPRERPDAVRVGLYPRR